MKALYIMLGNECNLHCRYCVQRELVNNPIPRKINSNFWKFFMSVKPHTKIIFYGGEPLLYFPAIKEIVSRRNDLNYGLPSNCKLLTDKMVEFFNANHVSLTVSWDGEGSIYTRGYDAFKENGNTIRKINRLSIASVLTKHSTLRDIFRSVKETIPAGNIFVLINPVMDNGLGDKSLIDMNADELKTDAEYLLKKYDEGGTTYAETAFIEHELLWAKNHITHPSYGGKCGNGRDVLNIDLDGRFYNCHNLSTPEEYSNKWDKTIARQHSVKCRECKVFPFCMGGCPITHTKSMGAWCKNAIALYGPFVDWLKRKEDACKVTRH